MIPNPNVRRWIYAVAAGVGAALAALGVVDADVSNQVLAVIAGLLTVGVGGLALPHTPANPAAEAAEPSVRKPISVHVDLPAAAAAVEEARRNLEQRLGR